MVKKLVNRQFRFTDEIDKVCYYYAWYYLSEFNIYYDTIRKLYLIRDTHGREISNDRIYNLLRFINIETDELDEHCPEEVSLTNTSQFSGFMACYRVFIM